ncbi:hypothetical protein [Halostagnicola sp. A-GB9-2]|uniref:hypothetical protein n=1 Tax=Halostagnicola sp. A-GB9-2 TaxID=3048066 RepID=UPI0024C0804C|nr:hypothetical protein [Halostagnicola sp. A-GB9-2]MDJ1432889.1 hypothetical protein [Halostagnicola sp. A-GB9-2]
MTPRETYPQERQRERTGDRARRAQLEQVTERLEATERRLTQLQNTVRAVAREADVTVSGPCGRCGRVNLLVTDGTLHCPMCGYRRSL